MVQSLSQARNIQEALDLLQNKINKATLFRMQFKAKESRATNEELKALSVKARNLKSELDELIQDTEKLVEKYGQDSDVDSVLNSIGQIVNLSRDLSGFAQRDLSAGSAVTTKNGEEIEGTGEETGSTEEEVNSTEKEDSYPQWLRDTIAVTWNDLENLSAEGSTIEDLEYLRRVVREVTQEQYRAKKENLQEEYQELTRLKNQANERLQRVQKALRKKVSPSSMQRARKFAVQRPSEKESAAQSFPSVEKRGFLQNLKEYFVSDRITEPPKPTTSSEMLALMKHGKAPGNQLKLFANLLASTTSRRTAYDQDLFGDEAVYRKKKVVNEDTTEADSERQ